MAGSSQTEDAGERGLTVVLPTYNGMPYLLEALASLRAQTYSNFQLYVIDDNSSDGTAEAAERFGDPRFRVVRSGHTHGLPANWNRALTFVDTPYFALCHQDDRYSPNFLEVLTGVLDAHPRAFIAHCRVDAIDEAGRPIHSPAERYKERFWPTEDPYEREIEEEIEVLRRGNYILMSSVLYRTAAVLRIGPFRTELRFAADWDYWLRGLLAGYTIAGTRQRLVQYRRHEGMATRKNESDLSRYADEIAILRWIAAAAHEAGLADDDEPDYSLVIRTVLSGCARRLASGDRRGARVLLDFAREQIPGVRRSPADYLARLAFAMGPWGGRTLQAMERVALGYLARHGFR
jgi:glycosyltransferase involved in cell wall biosynthesis